MREPFKEEFKHFYLFHPVSVIIQVFKLKNREGLTLQKEACIFLFHFYFIVCYVIISHFTFNVLFKIYATSNISY